MTDTNQKLREAFSRIRARLMLDVIDSHTISLVIADCDQAISLPTAAPVGEREAPPLPDPHIGLPWRHNAPDGSIHCSAYTRDQMIERDAMWQARLCAALPTQSVEGLPPLPETAYQLYYEWPDDEDGCGGSEVVDGDAYTADQMRAYARAALSAGDAVDAQRYRWLRDEADYLRLPEGSPQVCMTDEWGILIGVTPDVYPRGENLDAAIDAAMRKGQL